MTNIITTPVSRRTMLRRASQLGFMGAAAPLAVNLASAAEAAALGKDDYRALVCIFLYGGNDHGNTLIPADAVNYARYADIRGQVAIQRQYVQAAKPIVPQTLTDDIQYAFAPYTPRLKVMFEGGKLAAQLNVGPLVTPLTLDQYKSSNRALYPLPPKLFSHNDQQSVWQALGSEGSTVGWGGRMGDLALSNNGHALLTCVSAAGNAVFVSGENALQYQISPSGAIKVKAIQEPQYGSPAISEALHQLITAPRDHAIENELAILARRSIEMEGVVNAALAKVSLQTSFDTVPGPNPLADQLKIVARLIGARKELGSKRQVFFVSLEGFDHHSDLSAKHVDLMKKLDEAVAAFYVATVELGGPARGDRLHRLGLRPHARQQRRRIGSRLGQPPFRRRRRGEGRTLLRDRAQDLDHQRRSGRSGPAAAEHIGRSICRDARALVRRARRRDGHRPPQHRQFRQAQPGVRLESFSDWRNRLIFGSPRACDPKPPVPRVNLPRSPRSRGRARRPWPGAMPRRRG